MQFTEHIPEILVQFLIVLSISLLIGIEQRRRQSEKEGPSIPFGTDRTFTFIGVLGFILYVLDTVNFVPFISGMVILAALFAIYYSKKIEIYKGFGLTKVLVGLITYCLGPVVITQPKWLTLLILVSILILVESKNFFKKLSDKLANDEFITLGKFLLIAGVILPILPTKPISELLNISPYQIWLSLVVVSGISYASYLLQKFVFKKGGLLVSGILGGFYSSTATTLVIARKSKAAGGAGGLFGSAIVLATAVMYIRVAILMFIFNNDLGMFMLPYTIIMTLVSFATGLLMYYFFGRNAGGDGAFSSEKNPLELKIALIFSFLFLLFSFVTAYTVRIYGVEGLNILSYVIGFTDIDPFLLNLFQGKFQIGMDFIGRATFQAMVSNNILKIICSAVLADGDTKKYATAGLVFITIVNFVLIWFL